MGAEMRPLKTARPGNDRYTLNIGATIFRADGSAVAVRLVDLSFEDCEISSDFAFAVGERCRLYRARQDIIDCEVRWSLNGRLGLLFLCDSRT